MATISPAFAPSSSPESSSAVILPTTQTPTSTYPSGDMLCDNVYAAMNGGADNDEHHAVSSNSHATLDESTQGALDALAALASSSTAVSVSSSAEQSYSPSSSLLLQPRQITPHQTSSDDDSESMPPPPPRNPTTMMPISTTAAASPSLSSTAYPSFTFLHDSTTTFHNLGSNNNGGMGRLRSASNPEGMEKWDLYQRNDRQHFVLPSSILEEELASTRRALGEIDDDEHEEGEYGMESSGGVERAMHGFNSAPQQEKPAASLSGSQHHWSSAGLRRSERTIARLGTSPDSVTDLNQDNPLTATSKSNKTNNNNNTRSSTNTNASSKSRKKAAPPEIISKSPLSTTDEEDEDVDELTLEPEELLRRARSRLLEDLSESNGDGSGGLNGDNKGSVLILPHSLSKYKEVYNKNGRIGIYTPAERAAIIQKFNAKRARRMWKKKIRYNCRKNLADRRMRVKGRFVKRAVEAANSPPPPATTAEESAAVTGAKENKGGVVQFKMDEDTIDNASIQDKQGTLRSGSPPTSGSPLTTVSEEQQQQPMDEDMPDVNDEDAGFEPSEDMPYRRTRRYTIT